VEWHKGELFPRVGFIVTNLPWPSRRVVKFYNGRGTAEQWILDSPVLLPLILRKPFVYAVERCSIIPKDET
jgi:hypothetical protein